MVGAVRAHDLGPTLDSPRQPRVVVFQFVHLLEVELERALGAVDLESVAVLVAGGLAGGFKAGHGAAGESREEEDCVVDGDRSLAASGLAAVGQSAAGGAAGKLAFLDERFGNRAGDQGDLLAGDESCHVDDVGVEVAMRSGAGPLLFEPPEERDRFVSPVLEVDGADVPDFAQFTRSDHLVREGNGGDAAVIEPDKGLYALGPGGFDHRPGIVEGAGDRFFAGHRLAGLDGGARRGGMHVVGRDDVDQPDLGRGHQRLPVGRGVFPAPVVGERLGVFFGLAEDGVHHRFERRLEELRDLPPSVGVGATHEPLADQSNIDGTHALISFNFHSTTPLMHKRPDARRL